MRVVKRTFGKITKFVSKGTGVPCNGWRTEFIDIPGLILILESEKKHPGKAFVYFYPYEEGWDPTYYFHTSYGDYELSEDGCELCTENSVYEFEFGDKELPESAKQEYLEMAELMKNTNQ